MPRKIDPDSFGFLVADLARLLRVQMDRRIADAGIGVTPGEARALAHAARAGCVRQNVLAERMGVEAMTLSAYLDRLETRGLIARGPDPADRRAKLVRITEEADSVLATISDIAADVREQAAGTFAAEDWAGFLETLKTVRGNLSECRREKERQAVEERSLA